MKKRIDWKSDNKGGGSLTVSYYLLGFILIYQNDIKYLSGSSYETILKHLL